MMTETQNHTEDDGEQEDRSPVSSALIEEVADRKDDDPEALAEAVEEAHHLLTNCAIQEFDSAVQYDPSEYSAEHIVAGDGWVCALHAADDAPWHTADMLVQHFALNEVAQDIPEVWNEFAREVCGVDLETSNAIVLPRTSAVDTRLHELGVVEEG